MNKKEAQEAMQSLIKKGLVVKTERGYKLTLLGKMVNSELEKQERNKSLN